MRWLILALFAILPLQWFSVASTPFGTGRPHQLAIFLVAAFLFSRYRLSAHTPTLRAAGLFLLLNIYLMAAWAAVDLYNGSKPMGAVQATMYLAAFLAIATFFQRVANGKDPRTLEALKWAAAVTCVSVLLGFTVAMTVNGINPASVFARAVASADPELLQREVFRSSFAGFGLDEEMARGNLRHEIFGCVLFSMMVSTWAMRFAGSATTLQQVGYRTAMVTGTILLAISLSRSILIAAAIWPLILLLKAITSGRLSSRHVTGAAVALVGFAVLVLSGFGDVLWNGSRRTPPDTRLAPATTPEHSRLSVTTGSPAASGRPGSVSARTTSCWTPGFAAASSPRCPPQRSCCSSSCCG